MIIDALDLPSNSSVEDITKEIQANPEAAIRLRELELKHQQYLLSIKLQMDQAEYADRADARAREVAITRTTGSRDWFAAGLGVFVVLGFTLILCFMIFRPQPKDRDEATSAIINILVGALTAGYSTVLSYYFGSSAGSKTKDGTIALITQQRESSPPPAPPTEPLLPAPTEPPASAPTEPPASALRVQRNTWRDP